MPVWTCPRCRKPFEIPEGWETPKSCATCREQVRSSGPPKVPVPSKSIELVDDLEEIPQGKPNRRFSGKMAGVLAVLVVVLMAAISYGINENQAFEAAQKEANRLHEIKMEQDRQRFDATLEKLAGPPACLICKGAKQNDCPICVDGVADCGGCTDGVSTLGGKAERCFICAGKGKIRCDFCNAKGKSPCTFCNGTGVQK